jgi:hypothetical protein
MVVLKTQWQQIEESYFFYAQVLPSGWQRAEWRNYGEVQYRQVYANQEPQFYALVDDAKHGRSVLGQFGTVERAQEAVEAHFELIKQA